MSHYLYIPFSKNEFNEELLQFAKGWATLSPEHKKMQVIVYKKNKQFKFPKNAVIYVLAHGDPLYNHEHIINNDTDDNKVTLKPSELAERLKESGLTADIDAKIKLYFCNEKNNAHLFAGLFIQNLGEAFYASKTIIDFYNTILSIPSYPYDKFALQAQSEDTVVIVGKPKQFRKRVMLAEVNSASIHRYKKLSQYKHTFIDEINAHVIIDINNNMNMTESAPLTTSDASKSTSCNLL